MSSWLLAAAALMIAGLGPAMWCCCREGPVDRLIGLELTGAVAVILLVLLSQAANQSSYLMVPFTLVVLSFTGTLVFTRLLRPRR